MYSTLDMDSLQGTLNLIHSNEITATAVGHQVRQWVKSKNSDSFVRKTGIKVGFSQQNRGKIGILYESKCSKIVHKGVQMSKVIAKRRKTEI